MERTRNRRNAREEAVCLPARIAHKRHAENVNRCRHEDFLFFHARIRARRNMRMVAGDSSAGLRSGTDAEGGGDAARATCLAGGHAMKYKTSREVARYVPRKVRRYNQRRIGGWLMSEARRHAEPVTTSSPPEQFRTDIRGDSNAAPADDSVHPGFSKSSINGGS